MDEQPHYLRIAGIDRGWDADPDPAELREKVEPWLSAVLGSEHLALLVGNGLTTAVTYAAGGTPPSMAASSFSASAADRVQQEAERVANATGRGEANIEDQLRAALALVGGLRIVGDPRATEWQTAINSALRDLVTSVLASERIIAGGGGEQERAERARELLVSFLLTFASRSASRERLHVFSTNYDRLIEWACDSAGIRTIDRFVGALSPIFRSSRLDVDLHYNPPGIRGEPRYLEGVIRLTKLHGSLDWRWSDQALHRTGLPFGAADDHSEVIRDPSDQLLIYPNPAKDVETGEYPYAELFRDFSAALCRPNTALVTYGYGFGDDHINRVIADMLAIPSTHLVAVSFDWCGGRLSTFLDRAGREGQVSLLIGPHFGGLQTLVKSYLPKPAFDTISARRAELMRRRDYSSPAATEQ